MIDRGPWLGDVQAADCPRWASRLRTCRSRNHSRHHSFSRTPRGSAPPIEWVFSRRVVGLQPDTLSVSGLGAAPMRRLETEERRAVVRGAEGRSKACRTLMIYRCFPSVRIGQRGPGFFTREEPLPDSSLPSCPDKPHTPTSSENLPSPESPCQSLFSCSLLISRNPTVSSCLEYEAISYLLLFYLARSLERKRSPPLVLFSPYIFIVSRIDLTEQSQPVREPKRLSQRRAGERTGPLASLGPAQPWPRSALRGRADPHARPTWPTQTGTVGGVSSWQLCGESCRREQGRPESRQGCGPHRRTCGS